MTAALAGLDRHLEEAYGIQVTLRSSGSSSHTATQRSAAPTTSPSPSSTVALYSSPLNAMSSGGLDAVETFVAGYREHATLDDTELDRLADALPVHSLILDCWSLACAGRTLAQVAPQRARVREQAKRVADRARQAFRQ